MTERQPDWSAQLLAFPQPLGVLVDHATYHGVEAALLADPRWRCIWFDGVAGLYVPSAETALVQDYGVEFGARYFRPRAQPPASRQTASSPGALAAEAESLARVGSDLVGRSPAETLTGRVLMLLAMSDVRGLAAVLPPSPRLDQVLATAGISVYGYPGQDASATAWQPEMMLGPARARYMLNRALQRAPSDFQSWLGLVDIAQTLGDQEALWAAGVRLVALHANTAAEFEIQRQLRLLLANVVAARATQPPLPLPLNGAEAVASAADLIAHRQFVAAFNSIDPVFRDGLAPSDRSWELADLRGQLLLFSGDPAGARAAWMESDPGPAHQALRARRLANADFVEGRLSQAADEYRESIAADPRQPAARYGLAIAYLELGDPGGFDGECQLALDDDALPAQLAAVCRELQPAAAPYVGSSAQRGVAGRESR